MLAEYNAIYSIYLHYMLIFSYHEKRVSTTLLYTPIILYLVKKIVILIERIQSKITPL